MNFIPHKNNIQASVSNQVTSQTTDRDLSINQLSVAVALEKANRDDSQLLLLVAIALGSRKNNEKPIFASSCLKKRRRPDLAPKVENDPDDRGRKVEKGRNQMMMPLWMAVEDERCDEDERRARVAIRKKKAEGAVARVVIDVEGR